MATTSWPCTRQPKRRSKRLVIAEAPALSRRSPTGSAIIRPRRRGALPSDRGGPGALEGGADRAAEIISRWPEGVEQDGRRAAFRRVSAAHRRRGRALFGR